MRHQEDRRLCVLGDTVTGNQVDQPHISAAVGILERKRLTIHGQARFQKMTFGVSAAIAPGVRLRHSWTKGHLILQVSVRPIAVEIGRGNSAGPASGRDKQDEPNISERFHADNVSEARSDVK